MTTSLPTQRACDPFADRRAFPRVAVALPAFLELDGQRYSVQLLDLSAGGAKLDCPTKVAVGKAATLECGTLRRAALVRWQHDGAMGLCFDSELEIREVSALVERSEALSARMKTRD